MKRNKFSKREERAEHQPFGVSVGGGGKGKNKKKRGIECTLASLQERLSGARFRWINEMLYTETGEDSLSKFQSDASMFQEYHEGYQSQVSQWPEDPLDKIIGQVRALGSELQKKGKKRKQVVVADMGCGVGRLGATLAGPVFCVHSYDLVAANDTITACNIAHVPLGDGAADIVVFCLSLMGVDYISFLKEAWRILRPGGALLIAETKSRIESTGRFIRGVETLGFEKIKADEGNKMFVLFHFTKTSEDPSSVSERNLRRAQKLTNLQPCLYKRR